MTRYLLINKTIKSKGKRRTRKLGAKIIHRKVKTKHLKQKLLGSKG